MVAISPRDAERFLESQVAATFVLLFHGEDIGLVKERARAAVIRHTPELSDPFAVVRLAGESLTGDPSRLADEAGTLPISAGARSIWIDAVGLQSLPGLEGVASDPVPGTQIVIESGELRKDAPLRTVCERSKFAASIECPRLTPSEMERLLREALSKHNLEASGSAREALLALLGRDWLSWRSELDKLTCYAHGKGVIELEDVEAVVAGGVEIGPEAVVKAALSGDFDQLARAWSRARETGLDGAAIAGVALRHMFYRQGYDTGADPATLRKNVQALAGAIRDGRREPRLADALALRALWSIARDTQHLRR